MATPFLASLRLEEIDPAGVWSGLGPELRVRAARSLYGGDSEARREADAAIAFALKFRESSVRQMPVEKRAAYLARAVRPDDSLVSALLLALHLEDRREMLSAFLDSLGIPHEGGVIARGHVLATPDDEALARGVALLYDRFPEEDVEIYLASLLALDPDIWGGIAELLRTRQSA